MQNINVGDIGNITFNYIILQQELEATVFKLSADRKYAFLNKGRIEHVSTHLLRWWIQISQTILSKYFRTATIVNDTINYYAIVIVDSNCNDEQ